MYPERPVKIESTKNLFHAENLIAYVLRYGVLASGAVIGVGLFFRLTKLLPTQVPSPEIISELLAGHTVDFYPIPRTVKSFTEGLERWDADVLMSVGLILLMGLPILRVGMSVVLFLRERDWIYVAITSLVLVILLSGIFLGKAL